MIPAGKPVTFPGGWFRKFQLLPIHLIVGRHIGAAFGIKGDGEAGVHKLDRHNDQNQRNDNQKNMNDNRRLMFMVIIATLILVPVYFFKDFF